MKNDKTQSMVKTKTSDCIDNGISPTDEQNPIDELDLKILLMELVTIKKWETTEMIYSSYQAMTLLNGFMTKMHQIYHRLHYVQVTQVVQCPPPISEIQLLVTGSNVGRLIILLGSLLMMAGGFILSRGYRF